MKREPLFLESRTLRCFIFLLSTLVFFGCKEEGLDGSLLNESPVVDMQYTITKTTFVSGTGSEITSPNMSKEKINMQIFKDADFKIRVDILDDEVNSFYKSEAIAGNDYPIAAYYIMEPGKYVMYDTKGKVMHENDMPELDFTEFVEQLGQAGSNLASLPARITGGMLYFSPNLKNDEPDPKTRAERAEFGDDFEVYSETYVDEMDGNTYTQKMIVSKIDRSIHTVGLYDESNQMISKTSYRYEGQGENLKLKNTQDTFLETNEDGSQSVYQTISEYDDFAINLNLKK